MLNDLSRYSKGSCMSKNENMATTDEMEHNLDTILKPYIENRKKAGLDDDDNNEGDNGDDHGDDDDDGDDHHDDGTPRNITPL